MKSFFFTTIAAFLCASAPASAAVLTTLTFDSLPSAQGWSLDASGYYSGVSESAVFEATGNSLTQTMLGQSTGGSGGRFGYSYQATPSEALDEMNVVSVSFSTAVTELSSSSNSSRWAAHRVTIEHQGQWASVGIMPTELYRNSGSTNERYFTPEGFNGAVQNDYLLTLNTETSTYQFYWNGSLVASGASIAGAPGTGVYIMSGTGQATANGEMTQLAFFGGTVIPEPSSMLLFGVAAVAVAWGRRRTR